MVIARFSATVAIAFAFAAFSAAQSSSPPPANTTPNAAQSAQTQSPAASPTATPRIAPGSVIPVKLTKTVDAKKAKSGEEVTAKVTQDLKASNGMMLMPKDTEIVGHVTEAQAKNRQDRGSEVGIVFDHAMTDHGNMSYPLSIQAVISPQALQNPNNNGNGSAGAAQAPSSSMQSPMGGGRGMGGGQGAPANTPPGETGGEAPTNSNQHPAITGHTQGVIGFSHLKLSTPSNPTQASVISSEKSDVKLENGTLMLLRVDQEH